MLAMWLWTVLVLDVPVADFANFVGYVLWSFWLLALAVLVWRCPTAWKARSSSRRKTWHDDLTAAFA